MALNLASLIPLSLHPLRTWLWEARKQGEGGPHICSIGLCSLISWFAIMMQVVCNQGKRLCKCSSEKRKKIPQESRCSVGCLALCDWHSGMRLSCLAAPELDSQMFSHWKSKGPNLNFIIQPDIADQQNVLTQKYDNKPSRWRMASGRWLGGWREGEWGGGGRDGEQRLADCTSLLHTRAGRYLHAPQR